jgi:hypothetical protein
MRFIALYVLAIAVAACANNDTSWSHLDAERNACQARMMASPEFQALQYRLQSTNGTRATPAEASQMVAFHQGYLRPCQEVELEIAWRTHPSLAKLYNAAAAQADAPVDEVLRRPDPGSLPDHAPLDRALDHRTGTDLGPRHDDRCSHGPRKRRRY